MDEIIRRGSDEYEFQVARALTRALLYGESNPAELQQRAARALGRKWPWLKRLVTEILFEVGPELLPAHHDEIQRKILGFAPFLAAFDAEGGGPEVKGYFPFYPTMQNAAASLGNLSLPVLDTLGDLARWLDISPTELDWFADAWGWGSKSPVPKLQHYIYRWLPKPSGGMRLLEIPKPQLRSIQRKILREILDRVPTHQAAHGCVPGRSMLTNARMHVGRPMLIRLDLADFFSSIPAARVHALFRTLGYPIAVARYLAGLTTHRTSYRIIQTLPLDTSAPTELRRARQASAMQLMERHLPQGAPTSPALANLCTYRLDMRLAGAAKEMGGCYTRYVDDLVLSCPTKSIARGRRIALMTYGIAMEEGFLPNVRKTRIMTRSVAQRVGGVVVNEKVNIARKDYDQLKAILTNCIRHGVTSQNRQRLPDFRAHLLGRLSHIRSLNEARGTKLACLFDRIEWH